MPNQQRISKETMHQLSEQLRQKAQQPKPYTVQELLDQAKPYFQKMLKNGFSVQEIQQLLSAQEITIAEAYLEAFITGQQPPKTKKAGTRESPCRNSI